ncbi:tagatose-bisphosphate aldolase [Streptococcus panodentis]|uniref:Tagatose 1,6-diphosphate aldolase n=1 Tax=Streptococcus panodentis TaxID=1581472 RepID=A0ABS5AXL0_9STRE|nr:tagatose-bisphosphate aldolase [Streptococcus panodentis]MBP2620988.1 tagatose-bisphosphate aldolase [Streptococcus panodentis]
MKKLNISHGKVAHLKKLSDEQGIIGALAIDQRGSLKKMLASGEQVLSGDSALIDFKKLISSQLTPYATSILLDPEFGLPAADLRAADCGLIVAYEKTGYDATAEGRLPDLLPNWSVGRIREAGADAVKVLLYYDVDDKPEINDVKQAWVERIGSECLAEDLPYFLEILTYDAQNSSVLDADYARVKPHKVNEAMKVFSEDRYHVDVLKVEVPVNMKFAEGFAPEGLDPVYSLDQVKDYFREQSAATHLPFIFLSAGVSAQLFQETLKIAHEAGSLFNGVLCGRATWKPAVSVFAEEGPEAAKAWLDEAGRQHIEDLNQVLRQTAVSWEDKLDLPFEDRKWQVRDF